MRNLSRVDGVSEAFHGLYRRMADTQGASLDGPDFFRGIHEFQRTWPSSLARSEISKSHLLHFVAGQKARAMGCLRYDMGGFAMGIGEEGSRTVTQKIRTRRNYVHECLRDRVRYGRRLRPGN